MTANEAIAAGAGAAAVVGLLAILRTRLLSQRTQPAPPPTPPANAPPPSSEPGTNSQFVTSVFGAWSGLITTAGTIAAAVGTYQLAKDIGKGDGADRWRTILAVAAFAAGLGLLITIPVSLRTRNRVTITDAVRSQQRWNFLSRVPGVSKHLVVPRSSLFGYADIVEFDSELNALVTQIRGHWQAGNAPPTALVGKLNIFRSQMETIEGSVATSRVRSASRRAIFKALTGMILAVAGFSDATYATNRAQRSAEIEDASVADERTVAASQIAADRTVAASQIAADREVAATAATHQYKVELLVLEDALAQPLVGRVLPTVPSEGIVTFPDLSTARSAFAVGDAALDESCWNARPADIYEIGRSPDASVPPERIVFAAFARTDKCRSSAAWIDPGWFAPSAGPASSTSEALDSTVPPTTAP